jgi:stearoyl-CoA desaturase (delta-9 desaturase)
MHHRNADKEGDPHSPKDGLLHAYIGWIHDPKITNINLKSIRDIVRDKFHLFLYKYNNLIIWSTFIILGLINFEFMLWFWLIPAAWSYHQESLVNVICHTAKVGYKTYNTSDNAVNIPLLALITWGQALHNNHHYDTKTYNFAKNKKEFDPSVIFLPFIEKKTR